MKLSRTQIAELLIIIVSSFLVIFLMLTNFLYLSILFTDSAWATVLLTVVLVIINAYYAMQNRQTISEMEKARKIDFIPHVRMDLVWLVSSFIVLKLTNFGKGPAKELKINIVFEPSNQKKTLNQAIMAPDESLKILLPDGRISKVRNTSAFIDIKGEYKDIFDQIFEINERIDTNKFIVESTELKPLLEENLTMEVKEIKEILKNMDRKSN